MFMQNLSSVSTFYLFFQKRILGKLTAEGWRKLTLGLIQGNLLQAVCDVSVNYPAP